MDGNLTRFDNQESALSYIGGGETLLSPQVSLIKEGLEVVFSKEIPHGSKIKFERDETTGKLYFVLDGPSYEWIDLGLSVKWSNMNVGAETPYDNGLYFSWGNTEGHAVDENGNVTDGYTFNKNTYSTTLGGQYTGGTLDAEHDAATKNMGVDWRMPTSTETLELVQGTDHYYIGKDGSIIAGPFEYGTSISNKGLDGSKLRSICFVKRGEDFNYSVRGNFIEFPFAGACVDSLLVGEGLFGSVWSSSVYESNVENARDLGFVNDGALEGDGSYDSNFRYGGFSVRAVLA